MPNPGSWKSPDRRLREYGRLRYKLLPYLYSTAAEAAQSGYPVMRAMSLAYPDDPAWDACRTQYMLGDFLLVSVFSKKVRLPAGKWIDFWSGIDEQWPSPWPPPLQQRTVRQERRHNSHLAGLRSRGKRLVARRRLARLPGPKQ